MEHGDQEQEREEEQEEDEKQGYPGATASPEGPGKGNKYRVRTRRHGPIIRGWATKCKYKNDTAGDYRITGRSLFWFPVKRRLFQVSTRWNEKQITVTKSESRL